jgi:hypothetical protein
MLLTGQEMALTSACNYVGLISDASQYMAGSRGFTIMPMEQPTD